MTDSVGTRRRAMLASDLGHWGVPEACAVLPEAWELVEPLLTAPPRVPRCETRQPIPVGPHAESHARTGNEEDWQMHAFRNVHYSCAFEPLLAHHIKL